MDLPRPAVANREDTLVRVGREELEARIALERDSRPGHFLRSAHVPALLAAGKGEESRAHNHQSGGSPSGVEALGLPCM